MTGFLTRGHQVLQVPADLPAEITTPALEVRRALIVAFDLFDAAFPPCSTEAPTHEANRAAHVLMGARTEFERLIRNAGEALRVCEDAANALSAPPEPALTQE